MLWPFSHFKPKLTLPLVEVSIIVFYYKMFYRELIIVLAHVIIFLDQKSKYLFSRNVMCYAGVATAWWNIGSSFSGKMDSCCLWICWSFGKSKNKSRLAKSTMISLLLGFLFVHHLWHSTYDRYAFTYLHFTMGQKSLKSPGQKTCLISWFLKYFLWFVCLPTLFVYFLQEDLTSILWTQKNIFLLL